MEVSIHLFAKKGFDGTSIREIAKMANVNVASLNYHFKSKENLRTEAMEYVISEFKDRIFNLPQKDTLAEYAVSFYEAMKADEAKCLNQFKVILEAEVHPCAEDPYPKWMRQFSDYLDRELNPSVPEDKRIWVNQVIFSYIVHTAVMSCTKVGSRSMDNHLPLQRGSIPVFIKQLVDTLLRDMNQQYPK
jgi:AcrR family transcriptional regulator